MSPVLSSEGEKVSWINYKTGIRHLFFRMNVSNFDAYIGIEMVHKNSDDSMKTYNQFMALKTILEQELQEKWIWEAQVEIDGGQQVSRIYTALSPCNIFNKSDWPSIISFLKPRLIALDMFWGQHKMIFEMLE
jgi:hypothetical protein